jgi:hypothetical protein
MAVRMVAEGSVLSVRKEPVGTAIDVAPQDFEHPVYRAGFALACKLPSTEQPSRWKGPVEVTPQTALSDTSEDSILPEAPETLSPCEPPNAGLEEPEHSESAGDIEIPALSAEAEVDTTEGVEPPAVEENGEKPEQPVHDEASGEARGETAENTREPKDEL